MSEVLIGQQVAPLLRAGGPVGWLILGLGVVLTLWGVVNLLQRPSLVVLVMQSACSLIPALLGAALAYGSYFEFARLAAGAAAPKPVVLASLISPGLLGGMIGPLASVIPAALGIAGLARAKVGPPSDEAVYEHA